uniref:Uncharacterized protein n=1 Tax=Cacopsylla melanoneura TaxID=428564 RepID=A0A8D8QJ57_9HEMI
MRPLIRYYKVVFVVLTFSLLPQNGIPQQNSPAPGTGNFPLNPNRAPSAMSNLASNSASPQQQQLPQTNGMNGQTAPLQVQTVPLWKALTMPNTRLQTVQVPVLLTPAQSNLAPAQNMPQQQMPQQQMPQQQGAAGLLTTAPLQQQQVATAYTVTYVPLMYRLFG